MKIKSLFRNNKSWLLCLIIITTAVFFPTFFNDFQRSWDDQWMLLENPFVINASFDSFVYHLTNFYHGQYSPVNTLYYIIIYLVFSFNPIAFHTGSLFVHIISVLLVYLISQKIIEKDKPNYEKGRITLFSFVVALLFAIHPLQVEAVAWISASKVILYGFFVLLACWNYLKYLESNNYFRLSLTMLFYILAFGSKEQAIIFPLNLVLLDYLFNRYRNIKLNWHIFKNRAIVEKIPFFLLALFFWYFSLQNNLGNIESHVFPMHQRFLIGTHSFMMYIFRFLAPVKLYYYYFFPIEQGGTIPLSYWLYPVLVVLVFAFIFINYKKRNKLVIAGFLFFLINLLLSLHILPMPRAYATADRFMYLSIIGIALATVWFIQYVITKYNKFKIGMITGMTLVFFFFMIQSGFRTSDWKDSDAIKQDIQNLLDKRKAKDLPANNPFETDE